MIMVIFGGKSCEHDVSVVTGVMTLSALGKRAAPLYIDGEGVFWCGAALSDLKFYEKKDTRKLKRVHFRPASNGVYLNGGKKLFTAEAAVVCCHGAFGEDGCLQGLLEMSGIPYTCSGVLSSAVQMDKTVMKRLFSEAGLPIAEWLSIKRKDFFGREDSAVREIVARLKLPVIVKPASLGSSVGIGIAKAEEELREKILAAFAFDNEVIAEHALTDFTEINCAVLGDDDKAEPSQIEQPIGWKEFLSYEDKYLGKDKSVRRKIPAPIKSELADKVREYALRAFSAVKASGVARVDFMIEDEKIFVNEINAVPGSLAYYLFEDRYGTAELVDKLISIAKKRNEAKRSLTFSFRADFPSGKNGG